MLNGSLVDKVKMRQKKKTEQSKKKNWVKTGSKEKPEIRRTSCTAVKRRQRESTSTDPLKRVRRTEERVCSSSQAAGAHLEILLQRGGGGKKRNKRVNNAFKGCVSGDG